VSDVPSIAVFCSESVQHFPAAIIIIIIIIIIDLITLLCIYLLGNLHLSQAVGGISLSQGEEIQVKGHTHFPAHKTHCDFFAGNFRKK
jgi:hypothetical protein